MTGRCVVGVPSRNDPGFGPPHHYSRGLGKDEIRKEKATGNTKVVKTQKTLKQ